MDLTSILNRSATSLIALGVLGILAGLCIALWPGMTALTLALIWGAYALIDGIGSIVLAFSRTEGRGWLIGSGIIGVIVGLLVLFRPGIGITAVAWVVGVWLIARGVAEIATCFAPIPGADKALLAITGILWIIAGVAALANPAEAAIAITWLFGLLAIAWGVTLTITGLRARKAVDQAL